MPRKITMWCCRFFCGSLPMHHRIDAVSHEENCLRNPASQSCLTCSRDAKRRKGKCVYHAGLRDDTHRRNCPHHELKDELKEDSNVTE